MRPAEAAGAEARASGPLADDELDALFSSVADARLIALAVSGGADSLALLVAIERWRKRGRRPAVVVLTVDHGLRSQSRAEADGVVRIAKARGLEARVLTWRGPRPSSDIEAAARAARYRLLIEACREAGASHLLVAHHEDDVAETFLLRLKRGAGVFGLAAMRSTLDAGDVIIVRPFLDVPKARLAATTAAAKLTPVDDPMNDDPRFERTRMRRLLPVLAAAGVEPSALAAAAARFRDAADVIDAAATALIAEAVEADAFAVAWLKPASFASAPAEVRMRALARILMAVGGDDYAPRYERLAALADAIAAPPAGRFKRTLGGAVVERRGGRLCFYRESGRDGLPSLRVAAGFSGIWDHRFLATIGDGAPKGLTLGPLGEEGRRELGIAAGIHPAGAIAALPAIRRRGELLAAPSLSTDGVPGITASAVLAERLRRPPLFPLVAADD